MIPKHLIDKAAQAIVYSMGSNTLLEDMHPDDAGFVIAEARAVLEAVAADIWDEGYEAGEEDGYLVGRDEPLDASAPNPYRETGDQA